MKAFYSLLAVPFLVLPVLGTPIQDADRAAELTDHNAMVESPTSIIQQLLAEVEAVDIKINTTMATVSVDSSPAEKASVAVTIAGLLDDVAQLLDQATTDLSHVLTGGNVNGVSNLVIDLVKEISCTLRGVLRVLPLNATLKPHVKHLLKSLLFVVKPFIRLVHGLENTMHGILNSVLGGLGLGGLLGTILGIL